MHGFKCSFTALLSAQRSHAMNDAQTVTSQQPLQQPDFNPARESAVVAVYATHTHADQAIRALQQAGFDMKKLSIMGKDFHSEEHAVGFYNTGDRMKFWGGLGAFWGGLWGMMFGGALFFIPAIGPLVVMGPLVGWIAGALEGAVVGGSAGILGAALAGAGIPKDSIVKYQEELKAGKFVVIAHGPPAEIQYARSLLGTNAAHVSS
jgi:hypothetical protein